MIAPQPRIASRHDFFTALNAARAQVHRASHAEPANPAWRFAARQLETMTQQAAGGREPTLDERRAIKLGALVDRELEPAETQERAELNALLKAVNLYFMVWPADGVDPEDMPEDEFLARL